jgi:hypothetical protein
MSEFDKLFAFGQYLTERCGQLQLELNAMCLNDSIKIESIKRKSGHLESTQVILQAFGELYQGDLNKFKEEYLDIKEDNEDSKGTDDVRDGGADE